MRFLLLVTGSLLALGAVGAYEQGKPSSDGRQNPAAPVVSHDHQKMLERGEQGMAFSQTATTHHFLIKANGGTIQVTADDPKDTATRDEIRMHLQHIAHSFSAGDFDIPMFIHDQVPPGVLEMKRLKGQISYKYADIPNGGRMAIVSSDAKAVSAIQGFLRSQIDEHQTHDPTAAH